MLYELGDNSQSYWTKRRKADQIVKSWHRDESNDSNNVGKHQIGISQFKDNYFGFHNENVGITGQQCSLESYNEVIEANDISTAHGISKCCGSVKCSKEYDDACSWSNNAGSDLDDANCLFSDGEDSCSTVEEDFDLCNKLSEWAVENKVTATTVDNLLKVLHSYHPSLPVTYRSLLKTDFKVPEMKAIGSGEYMHYGIEQGLCQHKDCIMKLGTQDIKYNVNIDGLPLYKSSSIQVWPILGRVVGTQCMFIIGAFCGSSKPSSIEVYLRQFIDEAKKLSTEKFMIGDKTITASLMCLICDAPARAFIKQTKGHAGYDGCERCIDKGTYLEGRMTFQSTNAVKRSDMEFRLMKYEEHQLGTSPLSELNIGLVSACVLDSMHLVYLGIMRKLLKTWIRGPKSVRLSAQQISVISGKLVGLRRYIPHEFARKPRALCEIDRFKASEFRQFLLYTGIVTLKSELGMELYSNFLNLSVAIFTLCSPKLVKYYADYSESLLKYFVEQCMVLYGKEFIIYNVHSVIHIVDDAKAYGCLDDISSFPFENYLGHLKSTVRKPQQILQQIFKRLCEGYRVSKCQDHLATEVKGEHESGPVVAGLRHLKQYKEINTASYVLKVHIPDNCIRFGEGCVGIIKNIFSDGSSISVVVQKFKKLSPAFTEPLLSCDIGIYLLNDLSDSLDICQLHEIHDKMVLLPEKQSDYCKTWIGLPLLHSASAL